MIAVIWSGAQTASDVFLLAAAIVAVAAAAGAAIARDLGWTLSNAAVALVALGLLAL